MATATCWQCGKHLTHIITPVSRREECSACHYDIHACKMCLYFDGRNRTGCDEERADLVVDRERANFCEYYALSNQAFDDKKLHKQRQAKAQLAALFGDDSLDNEQATIDQRSVSVQSATMRTVSINRAKRHPHKRQNESCMICLINNYL